MESTQELITYFRHFYMHTYVLDAKIAQKYAKMHIYLEALSPPFKLVFVKIQIRRTVFMCRL